MSGAPQAHTLSPDWLEHAGKPHMAVKQISIDHLTTGMYVVRLDRPWPHEPELIEKHRITSDRDIECLKKLGVSYVTIDPTLGCDSYDMSEKSKQNSVRDFDTLDHDLAIARTVRAEAMTVLQGVFEGIKTGRPIRSSEVKQVVRSFMSTILRLHAPLLGLIHMRQKDTNLFSHATNVCIFALLVGKSQGFDRGRLERLGIGALLHDVGKLRLPRNLFCRQKAYTEQERRLMQQHPRLGAAILAQSGGLHEESHRIVLEHHEHIDGSGYPQGIRGLDISPLSEIVGIVDLYDGMVSNRMGRPSLAPAQAIKEIYQYGLNGHISQRWAERIIRCLGIYPVGSWVELSTGERGLVVGTNPLDALRPSVQIIWDAAREPCETPWMINLAVPRTGEPERTILRVLDPDTENLRAAAYLNQSPSHS